jgi:outer membrane protein OmpA-like peptidoglycan-associated protein
MNRRAMSALALYLMLGIAAIAGTTEPTTATAGDPTTPPPNTERSTPDSPPSDALVIRRLAAAAATLPRTPPTEQMQLVESVAQSNFPSGSDALTPFAEAQLAAFAAKLQAAQIDRVYVTADTDSKLLVRAARQRFGTNQALSEARAARVVAYLKAALKLPESAFAIRGFGASRPLASNATEAGRAQNRRAEVQIWSRPPPPMPTPAAGAADSAKALTSDATVDQCIGDGPEQLAPVRITVDGKPLDPREGAGEADRQRCVDVALARADIQVRYDPLEQKPFLNAVAIPQQAVAGKPVRFTTYTNYPRFIERAEIRVFTADQSTQQKPLAIIPVVAGGSAEWLPPAPDDSLLRVRGDLARPPYVTYVLRVYDRSGRFDETKARRLDFGVAKADVSVDQDKLARDIERAAYGDNTLVLHNIPIDGGAVTVSGSHVPPDDTVYVLGVPVPVDDQRRFVVRQILPRGPEQVSVKIANDRGEGLEFTRNLSIAVDDSFFVGLADFTAGARSTSGPIELVTGDATLARRDYIDGHVAFYYKGLIKGQWLLTAAADSQDQPLRNLFSNFASKNSEDLLLRIDPNRYYPVYGDDSTTVQDAPTSGKFYVRLEKGESSVLWGNFQAHMNGTEFLQYTRTLYGLDLQYRSPETTGYGEKKQKVDAFWADPGTLGAREEFRGTGGSVYYLQNQDVSVGSEQVWVQVRDKDSGLVVAQTMLVPAQDYDMNYMQGRILLHSPLATTADVETIVHSGGLDGDPLYLVVTYEYVPDFSSPSSLALGGRASEWFNDHWELGVSAYHQGDPGQDQDLRGVDGTWRYKAGTYIKSEYAQSDGAGTPTLTSITGGLSYNSLASAGGPANAERVEAAVDLSEVTGSMKGRANVYYQDRDANFSGPGQITPGVGVHQEGAALNLPVDAATQVVGKFDNTDSTVQTLHSGQIGAEHKLDAHWRVAVGARIDDIENTVPNASQILSQNGQRTDVAVTVGYQSVPSKPVDPKKPPDAPAGPAAAPPGASAPPAKDTSVPKGVFAGAKEGWDVYAFVQDTVQRTESRPENDRTGLGGSYQITKDLRLGAEASDGSLGFGAKLSTDYKIDERSNLYVNYTLAADQPDALNVGREGTLTTGTRYRYDDATSVYAEERMQTGSGPDGLTQAYGVDFTPNKHWTYGLKFEDGTIADPIAGDLSVRAVAGSVVYTQAKIKYSGALEWRENDSSITGASRTELTRNSVTYQIDPDWRVLGVLNLSQTDGVASTTLNANYQEFVLGAGWRPVQNDRWNSLFKFTILNNEPSEAQVSSLGTAVQYAQQSQVFDFDVNYQLTSWLGLGAKYALRIGELKPVQTQSGWFDDHTQLWILRADLTVARRWDALVELRRLDVRESDDATFGVLLGAYRHVGEHLKIGVGYNFTDYSDNLADAGYRSHGFFLNTLGKW